jgi:hypothetical protein
VPLHKITEYEIRNNDGNGEEGSEGVYYYIYKSPDPGVFLKVKVVTDSYGYGETPVGIEFVKAIQKVVDIFETI